LAPPPFANKAAARAADPFKAASVPPTAQEVRLVIDEKPVADAEVGRKKRFQTILLLLVGFIIGAGIGWGLGSVLKDRQLISLALADARDIYQTVQTSSDVVSQAQTLVNRAVTAARGGPGKKSEVDYEAIESIRALEKPFDAGTFNRKRYSAFQPQTVDDLFEYYNNVNILWERFERLANRTLPEARRAALNQALEATENVAQPIGCVPRLVEQRYVCGMVFVGPKEDGDGTTVMVRSQRRSPREFEKTVFDGDQELTAETADSFVILVDPSISGGVFGEGASEFAQYLADIQAIKALMERTIEIQGRLTQSLGRIATHN
jgi:hypothetical protein